MSRRRGRVAPRCMQARALLVDLAWAGEAPGPPGPRGHGPRPDHAERFPGAHLRECEECRAFAADLEKLNALFAQARTRAGFGSAGAADEAAKVAARAALAAAGNPLGRGSNRAMRAMARPLLDALGLAGLVAAGLACQVALLSRLGLDGFIGLHLAVYSLAPLSFYAVFRLDGRASRRGLHPTGCAEGGGNSG